MDHQDWYIVSRDMQQCWFYCKVSWLWNRSFLAPKVKELSWGKEHESFQANKSSLGLKRNYYYFLFSIKMPWWQLQFSDLLIQGWKSQNHHYGYDLRRKSMGRLGGGGQAKKNSLLYSIHSYSFECHFGVDKENSSYLYLCYLLNACQYLNVKYPMCHCSVLGMKSADVMYG